MDVAGGRGDLRAGDPAPDGPLPDPLHQWKHRQTHRGQSQRLSAAVASAALVCALQAGNRHAFPEGQLGELCAVAVFRPGKLQRAALSLQGRGNQVRHRRQCDDADPRRIAPGLAVRRPAGPAAGRCDCHCSRAGFAHPGAGRRCGALLRAGRAGTGLAAGAGLCLPASGRALSGAQRATAAAG